MVRFFIGIDPPSGSWLWFFLVRVEAGEEGVRAPPLVPSSLATVCRAGVSHSLQICEMALAQVMRQAMTIVTASGDDCWMIRSLLMDRMCSRRPESSARIYQRGEEDGSSLHSRPTDAYQCGGGGNFRSSQRTRVWASVLAANRSSSELAHRRHVGGIRREPDAVHAGPRHAGDCWRRQRPSPLWTDHSCLAQGWCGNHSFPRLRLREIGSPRGNLHCSRAKDSYVAPAARSSRPLTRHGRASWRQGLLPTAASRP